MRVWIRLLVVVVVVVVVVVATLSADAQIPTTRRVALIIGNGNYGDQKLKQPIRDAVDVHDRLLNKLKIIKSEKDILLRNDLTLEGFQRTLDEFAILAAEADQIIVYYSGHGGQFGNTNYLQPVRSGQINQENYQQRLFSVAKIYDVLRDSPSRFNLVMLNACRDNPFLNTPAVWHEPTESDIPIGTIVAFATRPGHRAANVSIANSDYSPYAEALLEFMGHSGMTVPEFFMRVRNKVQDLTTNAQTSWETTSQIVDFMFRDPAYALVQMSKGDDEIIVLVNGEAAIWSQDQETPKAMRLKPGDNILKVFVFNQKSCQGNCCVKLGDLELRPREGWHATLNVTLPKESVPIDEEEDSVPGKPLTELHWGASFQIAAMRIRVDTKTDAVVFVDVEKQIWEDNFTMIDGTRDPLDLAIAWAVWHEGVTLFKEYPSQRRSASDLQDAVVAMHVSKTVDTKGNPLPSSRGKSAAVHAKAADLVKKAPMDDLEAAIDRVHFWESKKQAHKAAENFRHVAEALPVLFQQLGHSKDFFTLRKRYTEWQSQNDKNRNAVHVLAALSDAEIETMLDELP